MSKDIPAYRYEPGPLGKHPYLVLTFAFNEGEKLKRQLAKFPPPEERQYDLMLSDDGSTDGSTPSSYISEFGLRGITRLQKNMGLSPNIKAALDWYLTQSYEGVILMNGNDRDGVGAIPRFINKFKEGYDYIQGSRFLPGGEHINTPRYRHLAIRLIHAPLFSLAARRWMTDTTNGFRGFSTSAVGKMGDGLFSDRFQKYEIEQYMAWKAVRLGLKVSEIPVTRRYPSNKLGPNYSKIAPGIGWYYMIKPLVLLLLRVYR